MRRGDRRTERLQSHPLWPEIELRLRHRKSPEAVHAELVQAFPDQPLPSARTLRRFVSQQPKSWFVSETLAVQLAAERWTELATSTVIEERRALIETVKRRIERAMRNEDRMGADLPILLPEVRSNQALLAQLLKDQAADESKLAAKNGKEPAMNGNGHEPESANDRAMATLAEAMRTGSTEVVLTLLDRVFPPPAGVVSTGTGPVPRCEPPCPYGPDAPPPAA